MSLLITRRRQLMDGVALLASGPLRHSMCACTYAFSTHGAKLLLTGRVAVQDAANNGDRPCGDLQLP